MKSSYPVFILSQFETALGVVWSLSDLIDQKIYTLDYKKDIAYYSRMAKSKFVPNPIDETEAFINCIIKYSAKLNKKPVLFITADDFLHVISNKREIFKKYFFFNIPDKKVVDTISNKYKLYKFSKKNNIPVPETYKINSQADVYKILEKNVSFPLFLKGLDVNSWRGKIGGTKKGFLVNNKVELKKQSNKLIAEKIDFIAQEIIKGPDTNHFKVCVYYSRDGRKLLNFTLRKIRQNPIHFGVGAVVESIKYNKLAKLGTKLFDSLDYRGVGSAEFKLDERDGNLKLIEINARYWQQNYLATACGMNFPLMDYLEITDQNPKPITEFKAGIKWVNRFMDFASFLDYRKEGSITFNEWIKSLRGKKVYSDFNWKDPLPLFYEIGFGKKIFSIPKYLIKKIISYD